MWRTIGVFIVGCIVGGGAGLALGLIIFPFIFAPPPAMEMLTGAEKTNVVARGEFIHADPSDAAHFGSGKVTLYERTVFLEDDFKVGPGPKYHVYLVPTAEVRENEDVSGSMFVDLGRLRSFEGSQKFSVPDGVTLSDYASLVIWCEQFGVLISPADLRFE